MRQKKNHNHKGHRTIRLPLIKDAYPEFISDKNTAKTMIESLYQKFPELFPPAMSQGYVLYGFTAFSRKQELRCRRIQMKSDGTVFTIAPSFILPYMRAKTDEVEKALFLRRFHVPYRALAHVFGRNAMFWYRIGQNIGCFSLVGTTVKDPDRLPEDLLADEKHTWQKGQRRYIAMTAAEECIPGASVAESCSASHLTEAYGVFAREAAAVKPDYKPGTVNTDGWSPTQKAWQNLFPSVVIILCFLHAFLKIRDRATKILGDSFLQIRTKVWDAYRAVSKASFAQRLRRLRERTDANVPDSPMKTHTLELCAKKDQFITGYEYPDAHRTSNMVDRLMKFLDRSCFNAQYFHGTCESAEKQVRASGLLWNFCPSSPWTVKKHGGKDSPAERLNGKRYADNWLENLLVSASMNGTKGYQQNPL